MELGNLKGEVSMIYKGKERDLNGGSDGGS